MAEENPTPAPQTEILRMAVDVAAAYLGNNSVPAAQVPEVINTIYGALNSLSGQVTQGVGEPPKPAVSVRRSVHPDYIVCLEDGKKLKMLKRHLRTAYDMSPEQYRERWSLPADYPMVAPNYAKQRSRLAKQIGLGTRSRRGRQA